MDQANLLENMIKFNNKSRLKSQEDKDKKRNTFDCVSALYEGRELSLNAFRKGMFSFKGKKGNRLKILTPKQIIQRLLIIGKLAKLKLDILCMEQKKLQKQVIQQQ